MKVFALIVLSFFSYDIYSFELEGEYKASWVGIEVIGPDLEERESVRKALPIKIGDTFEASEAKKYSSLCSRIIKEQTAFTEAVCSILWYGDGAAYLIVDFPEKSATGGFRAIPSKPGDISRLPTQLIDLYQQWDQRASLLMSSDEFPIEVCKVDFIDYEDPILHALALKLKKSATENSNIILDIIRYSQNPKERQRAATLFSWARSVKNLTLLLEWDLFADPDARVRNDIARSFVGYVNTVDDQDLLQTLTQAYCKQISLPTHGDRNKGLMSIEGILRKNSSLASKITPDCKRTIGYLQKASILDSVYGPASEIMDVINAHELVNG